jgi:YopX protein
MNREITFRIWDVLTQKFYYIHLTELIGIGERTMSIPKGSIIQQFTGLYDKNDKPIYEGDIVKTSLSHMFRSNIYVVSYYQNRFTPDDICDKEDIEVIGNIFENNDLVNNTTNEFTETPTDIIKEAHKDYLDSLPKNPLNGGIENLSATPTLKG